MLNLYEAATFWPSTFTVPKKKKPPGKTRKNMGPTKLGSSSEKIIGLDSKMSSLVSWSVSAGGVFTPKKCPTIPPHLTHRVASASVGTKLPGWANLHSPDSWQTGRRGAWVPWKSWVPLDRQDFQHEKHIYLTNFLYRYSHDASMAPTPPHLFSI